MMERKKILQVMGEGIMHGGEEAFINNLISNIDMEGLSIDWLTPYICNNEFYRNTVISRGGSLYEMKMSYTPGKNRWHLIKPMDLFFAEHHYDVVHIHSGSTSALALISRSAYRHGTKKIIVHSHTAGNNSLKSKTIKTVFNPFLLKYPTDYMACTMSAAEAKFPKSIIRTKMRIISNGIELAKYHFSTEAKKKIREEMDIPYDSYVIGHTGRFSPEKNHHMILQCYERVLKRNNKCYLLLIGDGILFDEIKQMAKTMSIDDKVRFAGYVQNISDYYSAMNLFVLPSLFEGFAIAAVEAQATGIPCILSDRISRETIINKNVFMLPIGEENYNKWAEAICNHLDDEPIVDQGLLIKQGFDIEDTVQKIREVYMEE